METKSIKTHLIVTDIHEEYIIDWCNSIVNTKPLFKNNKPIFILISETSRMELNTTNMAELERCAKLIAEPHGRSALTTATTRIYIKEENNKQTLVGKVTHNHIKEYAPMYDKVGWKES